MAGKRRLGQMLLDEGLIDELQLTRALGEQKQWGRRLGHALIKLGFVSEEDVVRVLARQLGVPAVRLQGKVVDPEVIERVPRPLARKYRCIPLFVKHEAGFDVLYLGMDDPTDLSALDDLAFRTGERIRPVLVGPLDIEDALLRLYEGTADGLDAKSPFDEAPLEPGDTAPVLTGLPEADSPHPHAAREAAPATGPAGRTEAGASTRAILRAVTELLIQKGVIEREELVERIRARVS